MQQRERPAEQKPRDDPAEAADPEGGRERSDASENRRGDTPPDSETGPGSQADAAGEWGNLPPYLNSLKNRGSSPKVPQRFRKYWEAYLRNKRK